MNHEAFPSQPIVEAVPPAEIIDVLQSVAPTSIAQSLEAHPVPVEDVTRGWDLVDGVPEANVISTIRHMDQAKELLTQEGPWPNTPMTQFMALAIDKHWGVQLSTIPARQAEVAHLETILTNQNIAGPNRESIENALAITQKNIDLAARQDNPDVMHQVLSDTGHEITNQAQSAVAEMINYRVEADRLPWTMPNSNLPETVMEGVKLVHDKLTDYPEGLPTDIFKVAQPMKRFEGEIYSPDDVTLMKQGGIDIRNHGGPYYTREELQKAGVFFVNRVGGGEQPLFGVPIPNPNKPGEFFDVQDRSFLTREEFDMVYKYQQENGYGLSPGQDAADVQMDMIMFATMPDGRKESVRKSYGFGSRENKYGQTRSPFVDLGFEVTHGVEVSVLSPDSQRRINTTTIHLANGHPDYPGVSEMFDNDAVAHDQSYMSVGEFTKDFYIPPTTTEQAFNSLKHKLPTKRESAWVRQGDKFTSNNS